MQVRRAWDRDVVEPRFANDVEALMRVFLAKRFQRNGPIEDERVAIVGEQFESTGNRKTDGGLVDLPLVGCGKMDSSTKAGGACWCSLPKWRLEDVS